MLPGPCHFRAMCWVQCGYSSIAQARSNIPIDEPLSKMISMHARLQAILLSENDRTEKGPTSQHNRSVIQPALRQ